jgi:hypothetical protein
LIQERVGNTLELVGIGKDFFSGTPAAQQLRDSIDNWDFIKLESFCSTVYGILRLDFYVQCDFLRIHPFIVY